MAGCTVRLKPGATETPMAGCTVRLKPDATENTDGRLHGPAEAGRHRKHRWPAARSG
jgi:hypothetical protein